MKWKKISSFLNHLFTIMLFITMILTLLLVIYSKLSGENTSIFGYQLKTVLSGSMEPNIKAGSVISIKTGRDSTTYEKGDIITFVEEKGMLITHRITEVLEDGEQYITQGDANNGPDLNPVLQENVIGAYTGFTIPYVGYMTSLLNSKQGALLFLILPGVISILYAMYRLVRAIRRVEEINVH